MQDSVTLLREELGNLVRKARKAAGRTQAALAEQIGRQQSMIKKIEYGEQALNLTDLAKIVSALGIEPETAARMEQLARDSRRTKRTGDQTAVADHFRRVTELEGHATTIMGLHSERLPGTIQSMQYMLAQEDLSSQDELNDRVRNRRERQKILDRASPPGYHYVLSESALRRTVRGLVEVTRDQIEHLLRLTTDYPLLYIYLLPFNANIAYLPPDFTVLHFPDAQLDTVYLEHSNDGIELRQKNEVERYDRLWHDLCAAALDRAATREFLMGLRAELGDDPSFD